MEPVVFFFELFIGRGPYTLVSCLRWETLLYAHLIADWPRHNRSQKIEESAVFFRFFLRILAFLPSPGTPGTSSARWNRNLEPGRYTD